MLGQKRTQGHCFVAIPGFSSLVVVFKTELLPSLDSFAPIVSTRGPITPTFVLPHKRYSTFEITYRCRKVVDSNQSLREAVSNSDGRPVFHGNTWSYSYNGSNQLTTITDPFSRTYTISYSSGYATSVGDFASHSSALAYSSGKLTSVTLPDPDGGGALSAPVYTYGYDATTSLLNSFTDPRSNATTFAYNSTSKRLSQITRPDSTTWTLVPVQTIGLKTEIGRAHV